MFACQARAISIPRLVCLFLASISSRLLCIFCMPVFICDNSLLAKGLSRTAGLEWSRDLKTFLFYLPLAQYLKQQKVKKTAASALAEVCRSQSILQSSWTSWDMMRHTTTQPPEASSEKTWKKRSFKLQTKNMSELPKKGQVIIVFEVIIPSANIIKAPGKPPKNSPKTSPPPTDSTNPWGFDFKPLLRPRPASQLWFMIPKGLCKNKITNGFTHGNQKNSAKCLLWL